MKVQPHIEFIKHCKSENIIPTLVEVNLSLKHNNHKLKSCITKIVMETELNNKNCQKKQFKKDIKPVGAELKSVIAVILYTSLVCQINIPVSSRRVAIAVRHKKKIEKFRGRPHKQEQPYTEMNFYKHIVHNCSTYSLSNEQYITLSYGSDTHIPSITNANMIYIEFEVLLLMFIEGHW